MILNLKHTNMYKKIYVCPSTPKGSCQWEGDATDILEHFQESHKDLLMDSNTIKADVTQDSEQNRLIASEKGLFLVQTKVCVERAKLWIRLRFLAYKERALKIRYSVEVSIGKFGFINEGSSGGYNPVYNMENGIEIDIQAIRLIACVREMKEVAVNININEEIDVRDVSSEQSGTEEPEKVIDINMISSQENSIASDRENDGGQQGQQVDNNYDDYLSVNKSNSCEYLEDIEESCEDTETLLVTMIRCTNCNHNMIPPIYMCPDGHSVCYSCKVQPCEICGQHITEKRNVDLEEHSKTLDYSCRYQGHGCTEKYKFNEIRRHEIYCDYCIYKCELCPYEGRFTDIRTHFRIRHPSCKIHETMSGIHFPRGSSFVIMNSNGVFYCTSCATDTCIEWKVVFCGPKERYFSCEVRIMGKRQNNPSKHYFLKRNNNIFKLTVNFEELKAANVKEKKSHLFITSY